jgi:hypothetical protein
VWQELKDKEFMTKFSQGMRLEILIEGVAGAG